MSRPAASLPDNGLGAEYLRLLETYFQRREAEDEARHDREITAARIREVSAEVRLRGAVAAEAAKSAKAKSQEQA